MLQVYHRAGMVIITCSNIVAGNCCGQKCCQRLDLLSIHEQLCWQHATVQILIIHEATFLSTTVASNKVALLLCNYSHAVSVLLPMQKKYIFFDMESLNRPP